MGTSISYRFALAFSAVGATLLVVGLIFLVVAMTSPEASLHAGSEVMMIAVAFSGMGVLCLLPSLIAFLVNCIMKRCATKRKATRIVKTVEMPAYHFSRPALYFSQLPVELMEKSRMSSSANEQTEQRPHASLPLLDHVTHPSQQQTRHYIDPPLAQSEASSVLMSESDVWIESPPDRYDDYRHNDQYEQSLPSRLNDSEDSFHPEEIPLSYGDDVDGSLENDHEFQLPEYGRPPPSPPPGYDEICRPPRLHAMTVV